MDVEGVVVGASYADRLIGRTGELIHRVPAGGHTDDGWKLVISEVFRRMVDESLGDYSEVAVELSTDERPITKAVIYKMVRRIRKTMGDVLERDGLSVPTTYERKQS
jgi:hypothetical protein